MPPPQRPFTRLLVANRGEIAVRILQSCRELPEPLITYALYTDADSSHIPLGRPNHAIRLPSPASYMDISHLIQIVRENSIEAIHPGYGFLSESADFSRRMWEEAGAVVVGPGWDVLEQTGDKLKAKVLAEECGVPILKALKASTADVGVIRQFAMEVGLPIMIKAVDGGGGRGIRLVESEDALQNAVDRAIGESPSKKVFAEKAAVKGFRHVEVQIIGDGKGNAKHLWERDCSVQRRFQKIVEVAPAPTRNREAVVKAIDAALSMASKIHYLGLGTWEFLVNVNTGEAYFLEINPRLQVEHTISESIASVDLVQAQLLLAQGASFEDIRIGETDPQMTPPPLHSIQLRICAEDPSANFALSIGKITAFQMPSGNGVRVDSHITGSSNAAVGSDFDNMIAKIIVTAGSWPAVVRKAKRALGDARIDGVKTNLDLLRGIIASSDFSSGSIDTRWLENTFPETLEAGRKISSANESSSSASAGVAASHSTPAAMLASSVLFRKGDAWTLALEPAGIKSEETQEPHHLAIEKVLRNEFPASLTAEVSYTVPASAGKAASTQAYKMTMSSTSTTADALTSSHRRADKNNKSHIGLPMNGKLVEVLVEEGDLIEENQVIAFVKQMKMELEIRSPRAGRVRWALEMEDDEGEEVAEGVLLAELEDEPEGKGHVEIRSKI